MPTGTPKEFAEATGRDHGNVYRAIRKGKFHYPDAELFFEQIQHPRVKWKNIKESQKNIS